MGRIRKIDPEDILGKKFGKLTILDYEYRDDHGNMYYSAKCDCGNITVARRDSLLSGNTKSCGCKVHDSRIDPNDIIGETFGELYIDSLVTDETILNNFDFGEYVYRAKCSCGNTIAVTRHSLKCDRVRSCGCLLKRYRETHNGMTPNQVIKANQIKNRNRKRK